jgi:hypothetical protein
MTNWCDPNLFEVLTLIGGAFVVFAIGFMIGRTDND